MARKIFLFIAAIFFLLNAAAVEAKEKEIPLEQRVKIFVEVEDFTNFIELATDHRLRGMLIEKYASAGISAPRRKSFLSPTESYSSATPRGTRTSTRKVFSTQKL